MRPVGIATIAAVIGLAVAVVAPASSAAAGPRSASAPAPAHGFAVGIRTEAFVDTSRPTPANGAYPGSPTRALPTLILYPALGKPGGVDRPDAPPASGSFPLVLFSHGSNSNGAAYEPLLRQWAEAGYVVAAPTFPLSSHDAPGGNTVADYTHQPGDVSFVITAMLRLNRDRARHFRGVIDPSRVAVAGHSLGAITTLGVGVNSCCADTRIRAVVSIDGIELPFGHGTFFTGRRLPLLLLHGDADQTIPYAGSQRIFADAPSPKYFVTLHGAPHTSFRQPNTASRPAPPWEPVVVSTVTDFLDRYLKGQLAALPRLTVDATVPGIASLQTG
jgi:predicted dienelactone hydrolase